MFRREIDGSVYTFSVAGLWGSGNTVTERELIPSGENTVYTMWDGRALTGPGRATSSKIEKYPALWARTTLAEFLERFTEEVADCKVMVSNEHLLNPPNMDVASQEECDASCRVVEPGHVATKQNTLRAPQYLDRFEIKRIENRAGIRSEVDPVDEQADRRIDRRNRAVGAQSTDREIGCSSA